MGLIFLGAALVMAGAMAMLLSYYGGGPASVTDAGKVLALLGFAAYVVGRVRYSRMKKRESHPEMPAAGGNS
ncbi:MAG: hypothetical protein JRJ26_16330 [Deltaproteobacteria bacterium]|nr:hypothetical protein [Deltaproteobacteria bacterium]